MLILATALPLASVDADRVVLSFASGKKDTVEIALTVNQALFAGQGLLKAATEQMDRARYEIENPTCAEVVPVRRKKGGR